MAARARAKAVFIILVTVVDGRAGLFEMEDLVLQGLFNMRKEEGMGCGMNTKRELHRYIFKLDCLSGRAIETYLGHFVLVCKVAHKASRLVQDNNVLSKDREVACMNMRLADSTSLEAITNRILDFQ